MKIALVAGVGNLPLEAAKRLVSAGNEVLVISFFNDSYDKFKQYSDNINVISLGQVKKFIRILLDNDVKQLLFAGKIDRSVFESNLKLDLKAISMLFSLEDRQEDTIMLAIVEEIEKHGIEVISQMNVLGDLVLQEGIYSRLKPTKKQWADIAFAYKKGKGVASFDIGQSITVKNKTILAIEAIEGTDKAIQRTKYLCKGGFTFMKVEKPNQDYRFDIPVIGMDTFNYFLEAGGSVFAIEAGFTIALNFQECVDFANKHNLVFLSYKGDK